MCWVFNNLASQALHFRFPPKHAAAETGPGSGWSHDTPESGVFLINALYVT